MSNKYYRILHEPISYQELKSISKLVISGIYKIENTVNNKVYIGQSKNIIYRLKTGHLNINTECNPYLKKAFIKYGYDQFTFQIIKETYDLDYWEIFLIQIYHSTDNKYGYNMLTGGEGGDSEVTRLSWQDPVIREKHKLGTKTYWSSLKGFKQKEINSQFHKGDHTTKGKHWYNNSVDNVLTYECPEGFVPGRLGDFACTEEVKQKKREWYANLSKEQKEEISKKLSAKQKGHTTSEERRRNIGNANRGRKYYNNGIIEIMQFEQPQGFVPGRLPSVKQKISKK